MSHMHDHLGCPSGARVALAAIGCALVFVTPALAGDAEDFNRRAALRDVETFRALDRDNDGRLTKEEVHGNVDLEARFDDLDIDRDGAITVAELKRYVALRYGLSM